MHFTVKIKFSILKVLLDERINYTIGSLNRFSKLDVFVTWLLLIKGFETRSFAPSRMHAYHFHIIPYLSGYQIGHFDHGSLALSIYYRSIMELLDVVILGLFFAADLKVVL